jgi:cytochrome oxidase Cu insertion factor (SCO1/SenC/PrrC family)
MSEHSSQVDDRNGPGPSRIRLRIALPVLAVAAAAGIAIGAAVTQLRHSSPDEAAGASVESWGPGARPAPAFTLRDQDGRAISLASLRGRPAIITFLDPLCRNVCPLEANVLNQAVARLPAADRPAIVAISVNRWGNSRADLVQDVHRWRLVPSWRWAIGSPTALAAAWRHYGIGVQVTKKTVAGVEVHEITHTLASFVIDGSGHERALFVWPFAAPELEQALASLRA